MRDQRAIPGGPKRGLASLLRPLRPLPECRPRMSRYVAIRTSAATVIAAVCAGGSMITSAQVAQALRVCRSISRADHRMIGAHNVVPLRRSVKAVVARCELVLKFVNRLIGTPAMEPVLRAIVPVCARLVCARLVCVRAQANAGAQIFLRIDRVAIHARFVMQMRSGGAAGGTDLADGLPDAHALADRSRRSRRDARSASTIRCRDRSRPSCRSRH